MPPRLSCDPARQILIACLAEAPEIAIGYTHLGWYTSRADTRLYYQYSRLRGSIALGGVWEAMIRQTEQRIREIAQEHPPVAQRYFQGWGL